MKDLKKIARSIKKYCPYNWAEDLDEVIKIIGYWLKEDDMWEDAKFGDEFFCQTGGFAFKRTRTGNRYIETVPVRIYID